MLTDGAPAKAETMAVKLADLQDNARLDRALLRSATAERDLKRIHRYLLSYKFLNDELSETEFRHLMTDNEPES